MNTSQVENINSIPEQDIDMDIFENDEVVDINALPNQEEDSEPVVNINEIATSCN